MKTDNLIIGFANTFYTLWQYHQKDITNNNGLKIGEQFSATYIKNISIDLEEVNKLYPNIEIDYDLKGKSFKRTTYLKKDLDPSYFNFGKYTGTLISECSDISYLIWIYSKLPIESKQIAETILENAGYVVYKTEYNESIMTKDEFIEREEHDRLVSEFLKSLKNKKSVSFICSSNLSSCGNYSHLGIDFRFNDFKVMYYNGFEYGLPTIKEKGKKIKNKEIEIIDYNYNKDDNLVIIKKFNIK